MFASNIFFFFFINLKLPFPFLSSQDGVTTDTPMLDPVG